MEQVIKKLSEIESTARQIMIETDRQKTLLSEQMEQICRKFDEELDQDVNTQIQALRSNLEKEKNAQLIALHKNTKEALETLDSYYTEHHERLSFELYQKILQR